MQYYNVGEAGNWEGKKNILYPERCFNEARGRKILNDSRSRLLKERNKRIRPTRDDKILTSWNALMMQGYVDAYFATGNNEYLETALKNAAFLDKNMIGDGSRLWRNFMNGKASIDAFLDDYALLARAYIRLYEATFDIHWLQQARSITEYAITHFRDEQSGLFFTPRTSLSVSWQEKWSLRIMLFHLPTQRWQKFSFCWEIL